MSRGRRGRITPILTAIAAAGCLSVVTAGSASAATCNGGGYLYGGQQEGVGWEGIEAYLNTTSLTLYAGSSEAHVLNLVEEKNFSADCSGQAGCWLQDGWGIGYLPSPCGVSSGVYPYEENADVNAYNCTWETTIPLGNSNFFNVYFTGVTSGGNGLMDGYMTNGGTPILIGQAWLPDNATNLTSTAVTEVYTRSSQQCPTVGAWQTFSSLNLSPNGSTWYDWSGTPTGTFNDSPYTYNSTHAWDAFEVAGG
jgi:hypothetical protein